MAHFVDQALREVVVRLLGNHRATRHYQSHLDGSDLTQLAAWSGTANYLTHRLHSEMDQCPSRRKDMSPAAGAAFKAALADVLQHVAHMQQTAHMTTNPFVACPEMERPTQLFLSRAEPQAPGSFDVL